MSNIKNNKIKNNMMRKREKNKRYFDLSFNSSLNKGIFGKKIYKDEIDSIKDYNMIDQKNIENKNNSNFYDKIKCNFSSNYMKKIHNENNNISQYRLKSSKYYLASFIIYIILININGILCESFISVKMKDKGKHKILFQGGIQNKSHICFGVSIHSPDYVTINGNRIEFDLSGDYDFKEEANTIIFFRK